MTQPRVVVVGDVMTDIIVVPEGPLVRGSDRTAKIRSRPGGSGANQAVWLGALGVPVTFAGRVGVGDRERIATHLKSFGVEPMLAADAALPSGALVTIVDPDGERSFLTDRGANLALAPEDIPERLLDGARMVMASGYSFFAESPRQAVMAFLATARSRHIATTVDPCSVGFLREVGTDAFLDWTTGADIFFANREEAEALTGSRDLETQVRLLGGRYARVLIKLGAQGAVLGTADGIKLSQPAPAVGVVDTSGAGDAFAAGFVAAGLSGQSPDACLAAAIAAGSRAVQWIGAQPPAPELSSVS